MAKRKAARYALPISETIVCGKRGKPHPEPIVIKYNIGQATSQTDVGRGGEKPPIRRDQAPDTETLAPSRGGRAGLMFKVRIGSHGSGPSQ